MEKRIILKIKVKDTHDRDTTEIKVAMKESKRILPKTMHLEAGEKQQKSLQHMLFPECTSLLKLL